MFTYFVACSVGFAQGSEVKVLWSRSKRLLFGGGAYVLAAVFLEGRPSNTMTLSAKYVAMMKSCSTTNAVFLA